MVFLNLPSQLAIPQHITKDNYTGSWEDPNSWIPAWSSPSNIILNFNAEIYGYITANSSISLNGVVDALTIADTLVIHGDLSINNTCRVVINDGGILIVRGNLTLNNQSSVTANGYLIVTGNLTKNGSITQGSLSSNDTPPKLFICGAVTPSQITNNASAYPVLNCTGSSVNEYLKSACTYGNCEDLKSDQIYSFFQSTCINITAGTNSPVCTGTSLSLTGGPSGMLSYAWTGPNGFTSTSQNTVVSATATVAMAGTYTLTVTNSSGCSAVATTVAVVNHPVGTASSNSPACEGDTVILKATEGTGFNWSGPNGFISTEQNPAIPDATLLMAGNYKVTITDNNGCTSSPSVNVIINSLPSVLVSDPTPVCFPATVDITASEIVTGSSSGLTYSYWTDAGTTVACQEPAAMTGGTYYIKGTTSTGCYAIKPVKVTVNPLPVVNITSSADPMCQDETRTLTADPAGGIFTVTGGPGIISGNTLSLSGTGVVTITYSYTDNCSNSASQVIIITENPTVDPGQDQNLVYVFETNMDASLSESQTGEWSLVSGSGQIEDIHSPVTGITGLETGENVFRWSVHSGNCVASADIKITVSDLMIPSVITPNGDGKNDFFRLNALIGTVELMIINKWGIVEYLSNNYQNDWDGRNDKGSALKGDVYFYVLKFGNGLIRKGTVLIIR